MPRIPTGPPEDVSRLSAQERRALLAEMLRDKAPLTRDYPLSVAQQRLWFLARLEPDSPLYNVPGVFRLTGRLDATALERALNEVARRHEILRTRFATRDGQGVQTVAPRLELRIPVTDLTGIAPGRIEETAGLEVSEEVHRPFDLTRDPPLRVRLLRMAQEEHLAVITLHHLVSDGWSQGIFLRELVACYEAFAAGRRPTLPELPLQYVDFAVSQREWVGGEECRRQLDYWMRQLADVPALELTTDFSRPPVPSHRGGTCAAVLPRGLAQALERLGREERCTLFMTLLAAFQALLARYSGQEDFAVGTALSGRNRRELEGLIGFFVNTVALRADLVGNPTFQELLRRVRQTTLDAHAHQDAPFESVVEEVPGHRDRSRNPVFQVGFTLHNLPLPAVRFAGLSAAAHPFPFTTAKFDLTMAARTLPEGLAVTLEYSADLFREETAARMLHHFQTLLEGVVADPGRRLSELPLLDDAEQRQVLVDWNETGRPYPEATVHELFAAQASKAPGAVAVVCDGREISYGELNRRANQLANFLRKAGVTPDRVVGICLERSMEMVVGALGVLKAGGAYAPLDPAYPMDRLSLMLDDANPAVLLTTARFRDALPEHPARVVCLDSDWGLIAAEAETDPAPGMAADHLAYVNYTSGSTGRPKAVGVPHRAVNRLVLNTNYVQWHASDRAAQASNASFDAMTFELWGALLCGASLIVVPRDLILSPSEFAAFVRERRITVLFVTTALFNELAAQVPGIFQPLRHLLFGGEAVDPHRVREVIETGQPDRLLHVYGPTESTTFATWHLIEHVSADAKTVPIGRPISNTQVYVLDRSLRPVPPGIPGELYIGGDGLARGYLNRPELTAEKFVPDPFGGRTGGRLYRTGDQSRWLGDGTIEFLGRLDDQVKVRGFRIELGEIEGTLTRHPQVKAAVVVVREDTPADKRLVAYLVAEGSPAPDAGALRAYLRQTLPDYMLPSAFVVLETLPRTPSGKLDRRALPLPPVAAGDSDGFAPQRDSVQERVARVCAELLGVERIGVHDDFFELGGHSLLAARVVSHLRAEFGADVSLREFFAEPTVAALAAAVRHAAGTPGWRPPPILPVPRDRALPLSFAQQRLWFLDQLMPGNPAYNIPAAVRLTGRLDVQALERGLNEIVRRHEALRTTFPTTDGEAVQVIHPARHLPVPVVDVTWSPDPEGAARDLAREEARRPFDLASGPLVRTTLVRLGEEDHVALVTMHHIVSDGWSMEVFVRELVALYQAFWAGRPPSLPDLPVQYADFACWQRQWLEGAEALAEQIGYWKRQLEGLLPLELPTDHPRPAVRTYRGAVRPFALSRDLSEAVGDLGRREGATAFMTVLAVFQVLLSRYTGREDIAVGSPGAGRTRPELEGLIGFFVNVVVLRTDLSGDPTFRELLGRVRRVELEAYSHQDVPAEKVLEALRPGRDLGHTPIVQVAFALQNTPVAPLELPGLTVRLWETHPGAVKCDLGVAMWETEQGLRGSVEYDADLFEEETVDRLIEHYRMLLEGAVAEPDSRLSCLSMLSETERRQLLAAGDGGTFANRKTAEPHALPMGATRGERPVGADEIEEGVI